MKNEYHVIGLMSGTSLDGLDMAFCRFTKTNEKWSYNILKTRHLAYDSYWQKQLLGATALEASQLLILHHEYGFWLGKQLKTWIENENLSPHFIASHGHTVFHQPDKGMTFQLGEGSAVAISSGLKVIADFRVQDVNLGGQGAPLVPIGDKLLFAGADFCLNLGGIANISYEKRRRIAFDICPSNMIFNYLAMKEGLAYDHNGDKARSGSLDKSILEELNALEYYEKAPPKSLGYEWFKAECQPILDRSDAAICDLLHTACKHSARQIAKTIAISAVVQNESKLLVTGGGARNLFFIECLAQELPKEVKMVIPEAELIDFKEALIFAFMGVLKIRNEINCLASVTGSKMDHVGGTLFNPITH